LSSTLFVAALCHGVVILGVTFTAGPLGDRDALPTLRVTLVANSPEAENPSAEDADFLAQRTQSGSGELAAGERPTRTLAADSLVTQPGNPGGMDRRDGRPRELAPSTELLLTRNLSPEQLDALPRPNDNPASTIESAAELIAGPSIPTLAIDVSTRAELPTYDQRDLIASPSTRESSLATYLNTWRSRVERIGTVNFPVQARDREAFRSPTLEVAIDADGRLVEIIIRRSSGSSTLDQAALTILRMAAPFEPLPPAVRAESDVLRFAYEWDFEGG
jgi:protein TonB